MAFRQRVHSRLARVERALQERRSSPQDQQREANRRWWQQWCGAAERFLAAVSAEQTGAVVGVLQ
jgi:hypothetical protein